MFTFLRPFELEEKSKLVPGWTKFKTGLNLDKIQTGYL